MTTTTTPSETEETTPALAPTLTPEQIAELLPLIEDSDSVELKLTVPDSNQRSAIGSLDLDPLDAQIRQVFFFDTPDLTLDGHGVVVRARRIQGRYGDSTVKLRPVVPAHLSKKLRRSTAFRVEVDALPGGFVCSGTLKGVVSSTDVRRAVKGERAIRRLFTKEQRAFYAEHAPDGVGLDDLSILGPIFVLKLRFGLKETKRRLVAEMWLYPDGSRVLELSARAGTNEAFKAAAELRSVLERRGVDLSGEQETKTRKALMFFAREQAGPAETAA